MLYELSIIKKNAWWVTGKVPEVLLGIQRTEYLEKIIKRRNDWKILVVLGTRRNGKLTLLYQYIKWHLAEGVNLENTFYITADDLMKPARENLGHVKGGMLYG